MPALPFLYFFTSLLLSITPHTAANAQPAADTEQPRQVILIVGDGMDEQQITIARNYLAGARGELVLDSMPMRGAVQVLTVEDKVDGKPVYVADSANTATSLATGVVTSRGRIATSAGSDQPLTTIVELAQAAGLRSGLVSTSSVTDATVAAFAAHINFRLCENPLLMVDVRYSDIPLGDCSQHLKAEGGPGSIAEQLANSGLHVLLGGGSKHFEPQAEGMDISVQALAQKNGFTVVDSQQSLKNAAIDQRLLGLFAPSTLPVRLQGEGQREAEEPDPSLLNYVHKYLGDVTLPEPMRCEDNPAFANVPDLKSMTEAALRHLAADNSSGFFLMIESASIDKQAHERKPCGSIGELQQLDEALASALAFAETHPRTLIIVTADHSQAAQLIPDESLFSAYPIPTYTPGKLARIITPEGANMSVNYATTNFMMEEHTGAAVPLYSNSEGIGRLRPFMRQPELFAVMRDYLGL
ncbi:MAG: alkaline phosphatase [Halioglobus sp.]